MVQCELTKLAGIIAFLGRDNQLSLRLSYSRIIHTLLTKSPSFHWWQKVEGAGLGAIAKGISGILRRQLPMLLALFFFQAQGG
jgi:hypothetical protein